MWNVSRNSSGQHAPSWKANSHEVCQEFPFLLWNPKFPHRVHKRPTLFHILSHVLPVHIRVSWLYRIHLHLPFYLCIGLINSLFVSGLGAEILHAFPVYPKYVLCTYRLPSFKQAKNIWYRILTIKLLTVLKYILRFNSKLCGEIISAFTPISAPLMTHSV